MKTNGKIIGCFVLAAGLMFCSSSMAYPPENAAVLYYKSILEFKPDEAKGEAVKEFLDGKTELTEDLRSYVESQVQSQVMKQALDASKIDFCDWGLDYSGWWLDVQLPPLNTIRYMTRIVLAEGKIQAAQKNYPAALDRCLTVHKMARHVDQMGVLISYLVAGSMSRLANETIQQFLSDMPADVETLNWLKQSLELSPPPAIRKSIEMEFKTILDTMSREGIERCVSELDPSASSCIELVKERVAKADERFYQRNRNFAQQICSEYLAAMNLPYSQAYPIFCALGEKPEKEVKDNLDVTLTAFLVPDLAKAYHTDIKLRTFHNAIRTAVEMYLVKAQTNRLPEALPAGLPKDLFSDKDFEYAKTADGFILRCQGKDLKEDKIWEYAFTVK